MVQIQVLIYQQTGVFVAITQFFKSLSIGVKNLYNKAGNLFEEEFELPVSQERVNNLLAKYVTNNVTAIHDLHTDIHDDWFRLYCTVDYDGMYARVAGNFGLIHVQLDANVQRFVFEQLQFTDVLEIKYDTFWIKLKMQVFIWFFHHVLKQDPLGFILTRLGVAHVKSNLIYIDINRYLDENGRVMRTLKRIQANHGVLRDQQLVLFSNINLQQLFASDREVIITPKDMPVPSKSGR